MYLGPPDAGSGVIPPVVEDAETEWTTPLTQPPNVTVIARKKHRQVAVGPTVRPQARSGRRNIRVRPSRYDMAMSRHS
jgi:hypothetical protein